MENNLERPNYYAIIPADVRYSDKISPSAKLLYGEITALANKTGTCWASNLYFSRLYGVNVDAVSKWVRQLVAAGFVTTKVNKAEGNKRYIRLVNVPIMKKDDSYNEKAEDNNKTNKSLNVELESNLLSLVNKITGRSFRTLPSRGVKKTLDAFSLDEIERALTALVADPWHKPKIKELSIDYFIRATTIDRFKDATTTSGNTPARDENGDLILSQEEINERLRKEREDAAQ